MKTLADFKRRLIPGLFVTVEFPGSVINGNLGQTVIPGRSVTRKVHSITPSMVLWEAEAPKTGSGSRLDWPKADCLTFLDDSTCAVSHEPNGKPFATYHFNA